MGLTRGPIVASVLLAFASGSAAQRSARPDRTDQERRVAAAALDAFTAPTLTRFGSEAEFRRYVQAVRRYRRADGRYYWAGSGLHFAQAGAAPNAAQTQSDSAEPLCPPDRPECAGDRNIVVTGSRIAPPSNPSITNNQRRGVEEGDVVKQIGQYLLVLRHGRIFVVDTRAGGRGLRLAHRVDVYRNPESDMWYDEMLVFGERVLVIGYSYDEGATELAVFRLGEDGRLAREGVFRISSNDYYSDSNYATRLIDGNLVTYTPLRVEDMAHADFKWPVVRRWLPEDDARAAADLERSAPDRHIQPDSPPLVDAAGIYRPVRRIEQPVVHTVSVCPLGSAAARGGWSCRTTAFVGPDLPEWYVTEDHIYLWISDYRDYRGERCPRGFTLDPAEAAPALVYRVPLSGAEPDLVGARGMPPDQFALHADGRSLFALVRLQPRDCWLGYEDDHPLAFVSIPFGRLGATLAQLPDEAFTPMPSTRGYSVASRFTDRYLVYGGLSRHRRGFPDLAEVADYPDYYRARLLRDMRPRPAHVVPIGRPAGIRSLEVGHTVVRAERVADDIVLTGYRDRQGLRITLIDLDRRPRIGSAVLLPGRFESESRSHAFNSIVGEDGSGLMGVPTVPRIADSGRYSWRSRASDVSFLSLSASGRLASIGALERRVDYVDDYDETTRVEDEDGLPGYECQVSCTDWYGNSRPIFTDGRIFGLSGVELIEGRIDPGRIREVQRLNIVGRSRPRRRSGSRRRKSVRQRVPDEQIPPAGAPGGSLPGRPAPREGRPACRRRRRVRPP